MSLNGRVDILTGTQISGWAADGENHDNQLSVEISVNSVPVARLKASLMREDLMRAGLGDGKKAFDFDPSHYLEPGENLVQVFFAGTAIGVPCGEGKLVKRENAKDLPPPSFAFRNKFELRRPSTQTAIDIFAGAWSSDLSQVIPGLSTGDADLFVGDLRPRFAAESLGRDGQTFSNMRVLELGPLEAGHTYQIEKLGASEILSVEANVEAYLKCLIVKEVLDIQRAKFLFGDIVEYLKASSERFDLVFCSGVLYHMSHPLELIELVSRVTDRVFVWTHYFNEERYPGHIHKPVKWAGFDAVYHEAAYGQTRDVQRFWGGNRPVAAFLEKQAILDAFRHFGFADVVVLGDDPDHPNGPSFMFTAKR